MSLNTHISKGVAFQVLIFKIICHFGLGILVSLNSTFDVTPNILTF